MERGDPLDGAPGAARALRETARSLRSSRERLPGPSGVAGMNLGYPWWLLTAVLVTFALLLYYLLRERVSGWPLAGLSAALAPVCALAVVAVAVTLSAAISPLYEAPAEPPVETGPSSRERPVTTAERTEPTTTLESTGTGTASPTASPSAQPSASPSASPSPSATASSSASPSP